MSLPSDDLAAATEVLRHWPALVDARLEPIHIGLINLTFRVERADGERFVLQRLHPIFGAELHRDIEAVTGHLAAHGLATPRLVRTEADALWVEQDGVWRVLTHLEGRTVQRVAGPDMAREAAALLGRFHRALADLEHEFCFVRQAHGLAMHAGRLREALESHPEHRLYDAVAPVAGALLSAADALPALDALPQRITHGDPKISNILFLPPDDRAHALVDLDTLGRLDLPTELGDAFRSWCNPEGEDGGPPELDLSIFEAAVDGYASVARSLPTAAERELLVAGLQIICVELACRFAADALNESYFGWNPDRYPSRGDHNLHRARVQLSLARSVAARRTEAEAIVARAFTCAP
jgi:Ser/Thr protein kinase RdoA (MazF antagonist)